MNQESFKMMIPTPCPSCIDINGSSLYIADISTGEISVINLKDRSVSKRISSTVVRPKLITSDEDFIYIYDEMYNAINRIDPETEDSYPFGGFVRANHPYYGIAVDKKNFFVLSPDIPWYPSRSLSISVYDKNSKVLLDTYPAPTYGSRGLFSDGTCLYTMDFIKGSVFVMDIKTGVVIDEQQIAGRNLLDIALHEKTFFTIDAKENSILGFMRSEKDYDLHGEPMKSEIVLGDVYINNGPGTIINWMTAGLKPEDYLHQHIMQPPEIIPETTDSLKGYWDGAEYHAPLFNMKDMPPGQVREIKIKFQAITRDLRFHLDPVKTLSFEDIPEEVSSRFLLKKQYERAEGDDKKLLEAIDKTFQFTNDKVKEEAEKITGDEKNLLIMVLKLFRHVIKEIEYTLPYQSLPVLKILEEKKGSCGNHSALFSSLCQSLGFPTRSIIGFCIWENDARAGYLDHEIPEVYIPPYGFIPMDTSRFMSIPNYSGLIGDDFVNFGRLDKRFVVCGFRGYYDTDYFRFLYLNRKKVTSRGYADTNGNFYVDWKTVI